MTIINWQGYIMFFIFSIAKWCVPEVVLVATPKAIIMQQTRTVARVRKSLCRTVWRCAKARDSP